jgi:DNA-binding transcriptional LysR family regulator
MPRLEQMVRGEDFAPARSQEIFRVAMSDHAAMVVLPSLLATVRRTATHIKLEVFPSGAETYGDVAAGRIDTFLCPEETPHLWSPKRSSRWILFAWLARGCLFVVVVLR